MNNLHFDFCTARLSALGSGALFWPARGLLCVSDLHLGKSERIARRGGPQIPPYEVIDTLTRLESDLQQTGAKTVICLGDSFDDLIAERSIDRTARDWIERLQVGRRWIWIEGNHDPGPTGFEGEQRPQLDIGPLSFRHVAQGNATGEISGHYHPKASVQVTGRRITRPAFLFDWQRLILPAYGTYTGGMRCSDPVFCNLLNEDGHAILTGAQPTMLPLAHVS